MSGHDGLREALVRLKAPMDWDHDSPEDRIERFISEVRAALAEPVQPEADPDKPHIPQPSDICSVCGRGLVHVIPSLDPTPPASDPVGLDVERVHRITCDRLIEHEPGRDTPYLWPCTQFARQYSALPDTQP
jgi:hypothetical protein